MTDVVSINLPLTWGQITCSVLDAMHIPAPDGVRRALMMQQFNDTFEAGRFDECAKVLDQMIHDGEDDKVKDLISDRLTPSYIFNSSAFKYILLQ